jgi:hypothetical protein
MKKDDAGFSYGEIKGCHAFLQWKGTDACFDFHCKCGNHVHFDGMFAYYVKCPWCAVVWQMPFNLFPREVPVGEDITPILMEKDGGE